jgi:hypothetical protein
MALNAIEEGGHWGTLHKSGDGNVSLKEQKGTQAMYARGIHFFCDTASSGSLSDEDPGVTPEYRYPNT